MGTATDGQDIVQQEMGGRTPSGTSADPPVQPRRVDEVHTHSELVEDVLGVPPRWMVRWGNTLISLALAALLVLGWIVRYPDVVPASAVITTSMPPSRVVAQASGDLIDVRVRGGEHVARGALLAVIRNSADHAAVFQLQALLDKLGPDLDRASFDVDFPEALSLGELQPDYSAFLRAYRAYRFDLAQDPVGQEIRHLEPQLASQRQRIQKLQRQREGFARQVDLAARDLDRSRKLVAARFVSSRDLEARERAMLEARHGLDETDVDTAQAQVELNGIEQTLAGLRVKARQQREDLRLALSQAGKNLRSRLAVWERSYVLVAPIEGRVSLDKVWTDHQFVKSGDSVLAVVPEGEHRIIGRLSMPIGNSGKVRVGQPVYIRLENYPWQEYGQLRGIVQSISSVPQEARYAVEVALPDGLRTSYDRQLEWRQEMQGQAGIVVEDLRLLERVFYQFRKIVAGAVQSPDIGLGPGS